MSSCKRKILYFKAILLIVSEVFAVGTHRLVQQFVF